MQNGSLFAENLSLKNASNQSQPRKEFLKRMKTFKKNPLLVKKY